LEWEKRGRKRRGNEEMGMEGGEKEGEVGTGPPIG